MWKNIWKTELSWLNIIAEVVRKKEDHQKLLSKVNNCKKEILEFKNGYIVKMNNKPNKPNAVPKT